LGKKFITDRFFGVAENIKAADPARGGKRDQQKQKYEPIEECIRTLAGISARLPFILIVNSPHCHSYGCSG
jgi:hypothetical protein